MWPNPQESADLVTLTGEILDGKLHFLCEAIAQKSRKQFFFIESTNQDTMENSPTWRWVTEFEYQY